ncbi:MAG: hypothetical protein GQ574_04480 [Crocinitomix sp.]|nr:hypothetical protein [Crocinitomix sp.]
MHRLLFLLSLFCTVTVFGQTPKKLQPIFNFDYIQLKPVASYNNIIAGNVMHDSSLSQKGDTTGIHNGIEFLRFRDEISNETEIEVLKLLRIDWVNNTEYDAFYAWVLDSIYREKIYENTNPTGNSKIPPDIISDLLIHGDYRRAINGNDSVIFNSGERFINREVHFFDYNYDWRKRVRAHYYIPLLSDLYLRPNERFYKNKELDDRKVRFRSSKKNHWESLVISRDRQIWAKKSIHPFDIYYNLANHYYKDEAFKNNPVQGLLGNQAQAFLIYLEKFYQAQINVKKIPYRIRLTLPSLEEIEESGSTRESESKRILINETDMTEHWRISNADYYEFLGAIQDSILREIVYTDFNPSSASYKVDELRAKFLTWPNVYYDEVNLEWKEYDPSQTYINRYLFPFDYKFKWTKKIPESEYREIIESFFTTTGDITNPDNFDKSKFHYKYYWQDLKRKGNIGEFIWQAQYRDYPYPEYLSINWSRKPHHRGLDLGNGIRRSEDYSDHILEEDINIYPGIDCKQCNLNCAHEAGKNFRSYSDHYLNCDKCLISDSSMSNVATYDFKSNPDALVQGVTYAQALAFYNWKFLNKSERGHFDEIILDELLPSEAEFEKIQAGESIIRKAEKIDYPTPFFRYVVHIYDK